MIRNQPLRHSRTILAASLLLALSLFTASCSESSNYVGTPIQTNGAIASLSTSVLAFGPSPVGMTSATQSVTLTNTGSVMSFFGATVTGANPNAFLTTTNCASPIPKGSSCTISVAFAPASATAQTATLQLADNAPNTPQLIALSGTGTASGPIASLSASSLTFTSLPVGQASTQTVTLTNIGTGSLTLSGFTLGGTNATSFALSGSCLTTAAVAAGNNCFLTVTYAPTVTGSLNAVVNVNSNAPNSPQTITLASR